MSTEFRDTKHILKDIGELVKTKGYIYSLCLILMDDFHFNVEKMHEIDFRSRLNKNEVSLIIGFMLKKSISLEKPESYHDAIRLKKQTYSLMEELHMTLMKPMIDKFKPLLENMDSQEFLSKKDFFGGEDLFIEPIFYAGNGIYDFQYLDFLEKKYKYDENWLKKNKGFKFKEVIEIAIKIKDIHQDKLKKVSFLDLRENKSEILKKFKKDKLVPRKTSKDTIEQLLEVMEFYQFYELFNIDENVDKGLSPETISKKGWSTFYDGLLDLFCVSPSDFSNDTGIINFLKNFSIPVKDRKGNSDFRTIGDFNIFSAKPILKLDSDRYFVPIVFSVFEAVYESPYYWMLEDNEYKNHLAENRGKVGEEITADLLSSVFGKNRVYPSVRIESKKGYDDTDIDVLCILGSKALCVQVKSKKLTQLSRKGSFDQLERDFKGAVQDAYGQALICRERVLEKSATFYNCEGKKIQLSEDIDEVYLLGVTTENYPTLTHQTFTLLEKSVNEPNPLFLTIFDLELVLFYLKNPYDFLYYVRQRTQLMECFQADEEIHFLGYHLIHKLWKDPDADYIHIDPSIGQLIDRNYYPYKLGIETSSKNDVVHNRWQNKDFEILCQQISELNFPKTTDIIFHLFDWSIQSRDNMINQIKSSKTNTLKDQSKHNFTMITGPNKSSFGLTYFSWNTNDSNEMTFSLLKLCKLRKYKSKADYWIGLGSLKDSGRLVDGIVFNDDEWEFDQDLEREVEDVLGGVNQPRYVKFGKKIGRNDPCPCASGKKYKKCCGRGF